MGKKIGKLLAAVAVAMAMVGALLNGIKLGELLAVVASAVIVVVLLNWASGADPPPFNRIRLIIKEMKNS
jgi:uncharacterized membrane protein YfcA